MSFTSLSQGSYLWSTKVPAKTVLIRCTSNIFTQIPAHKPCSCTTGNKTLLEANNHYNHCNHCNHYNTNSLTIITTTITTTTTETCLKWNLKGPEHFPAKVRFPFSQGTLHIKIKPRHARNFPYKVLFCFPFPR
jgi:hypothetical protein